MKLNTVVRPTLFSLLVLLSACSSNVKHLVIAPEVFTSANTSLTAKSVNISTNDLRPGQHLLQILKKDQAAEIINSQAALAQIVANTLTSAYKSSGAQVSPAGKNVLNITINNALINVNQTLLNYTASNMIVLSISIDNGEKTLTKRYRSSGKNEGPLKADIAVLERDFNQQLSKLIYNIVNDPQLIEFMR